jgi:predicted lipoprotein with Yx(FWY)xxD motif
VAESFLSMRKRLLPLAPVAIALIAAGCGSSGKATTTSTSSSSTPASTAPSSGSVTISSRDVSGVGNVLVDAQGKTLYIFKPDDAKKVTCTGGCASVWPPVTLASGAKPAASGAVKGSLLSSDPNPAGGKVVTYNGWPLYAYVADTGPGSAKGQGVNLNGGLWYTISPTGQPVTKTVSSSGSSSSGYGSSGGYG